MLYFSFIFIVLIHEIPCSGYPLACAVCLGVYDFEKDSYVYLFRGNRELTSSSFLIFFEIIMKNSLACEFRQKLICLLNIVKCGIA